MIYRKECADVLKMQMTDITGEELIVRQGKTGKTVRIALVGRLAELIERVKERACLLYTSDAADE